MSIIDRPASVLDDCPNLDVPQHPGRKLSEEEFIAWSGAFWAEWVDGEVIMMSVNRDHAMFQNFFSTILSVFVDKNDLGAVYSEPFQIRLGARRRRRMPDVFFVAKTRMDVVHEQEVEGAPDLVVEILSPESQSRDWREKFLEYELVGVREYWIVDPVSGLIEAYQWQDGKFAGLKEKDGKIASEVLRGFFVRADWFKQGQLPRIHEALRELGL